MKNKKNTVWIILTCLFAVAVFVLAAAWYRSSQTVGELRTQLAEAQNRVQLAETAQGQQELAAAGNGLTVRVMNGILQQQDADGQWMDVAPVEELCQADPVLAGREKMQEIIAQNQEAVQNGTVGADQISPLLAKQGIWAGAALASVSQVEGIAEKTAAAQPSKPAGNAAAAVTPATTPAPVQQPVVEDNSSSDDDSDDSDSGDNGQDDNSSDSGSSDSGSSDSGSSDSSDSSDSGDGEDVGWTDEIL